MPDLPRRKHPRLKSHDYSLPGFYYATIHAQDADICFSHIRSGPQEAIVCLTALGKIAQEQLLALESRFSYVRIDKYVVMPTHIHVVMQLMDGKGPRSGLTDILCAYKSLTTRMCNQQLQTPGKKRFQTSFYETVLRNEQAYRACWQYIDNNPAKWLLHEETPEFVP